MRSIVSAWTAALLRRVSGLGTGIGRNAVDTRVLMPALCRATGRSYVGVRNPHGQSQSGYRNTYSQLDRPLDRGTALGRPGARRSSRAAARAAAARRALRGPPPWAGRRDRRAGISG